jgi:hypothetical protein
MPKPARRRAKRQARPASGRSSAKSDGPDNDDSELIGSFEKNSKEQVRVHLGEFREQTLVNVRTWFRKDGEHFPSSKGIAIRVSQLPALIDLLQIAYQRATDEGMLDE